MNQCYPSSNRESLRINVIHHQIVNLYESNSARHLAIKHLKDEISRAEKEIIDCRNSRKNYELPVVARIACFMLEKSYESIIYWLSFLLKKYEK